MEKGICKVTGIEFEITPDDLAFYEKMGVPPPRLCPEERSRRRMAFANQRALYHRTCDGSGKQIITNFSPLDLAKVYDIEYWFSDSWNQYETGREFDFSRSFFEQFGDLMSVAPRPSLQRSPQFDENSDFTNYAGKNKNCYLIFDSDKNRDCLYSYSVNSSEDVVDCFRVEKCELCYECVDCTNCYSSLFLQNCDNCSDSAFLKSCIGCSDCFGCVNLRNKKFHFLNESCSEEDYRKKLSELGLHTRSGLEKWRTQFFEYAGQFAQKYMQGIQNENVIGDYLTFSKNAFHCFDSRKLWDCKYITQAFDDAKDCMDCDEVGDGVELFYECSYAGYNGHYNRFVSHCLGQTSNLTYCYYCPFCSDCFGCTGLHHARFCILNKQYSEEEYKLLVPRIQKQMEEAGEWGEFFPASIAPFPYNRTHAQEFYPLSEAEARKRGYAWEDKDEREYQPAELELPDSIEAVGDDVVDKLLACRISGKNYKIQKAELEFSRKMNIPLPDCCFDERHLARVKRRNGRELFERQCAECSCDILTTISPDRPEKVVCEDDFLRLVE